jgi:pyridinium-3,5-biscarboxylic acid mononucleotide sulfurtransferase
MDLKTKLYRLKKILNSYGSFIIAFSGGVDSSFLLAAARRFIPKNKILAVTAVSKTYPLEELSFSRKICRKLGIRQKIIRTRELKNNKFISNPANRCYFCKKELFGRLNKLARDAGFKEVIDASTVSDKIDFRPGNLAKLEFNVRSPLLQAGFTKQDIRSLSKAWGLSSWDKPAMACLASRIPYGIKITSGILKRIEKAESYLMRLGFKVVRVRDYGISCRIEVAKDRIGDLLSKKSDIVKRFKKLGYNFITLDLEGYRCGSLNQAIGK